MLIKTLCHWLHDSCFQRCCHQNSCIFLCYQIKVLSLKKKPKQPNKRKTQLCHCSLLTVLSFKISCKTLQGIGRTAWSADLINTISIGRKKHFVLSHACGTIPDFIIVKIWSAGLEISWVSSSSYFDSPQILGRMLSHVLKLLIGMDP